MDFSCTASSPTLFAAGITVFNEEAILVPNTARLSAFPDETLGRYAAEQLVMLDAQRACSSGCGSGSGCAD